MKRYLTGKQKGPNIAIDGGIFEGHLGTGSGHNVLSHVCLTFTDLLLCRAKEVDWVNYVTRTAVEDFASHIRLFHSAQEKHAKLTKKEGKIIKSLFIVTKCTLSPSGWQNGRCL